MKKNRIYTLLILIATSSCNSNSNKEVVEQTVQIEEQNLNSENISLADTFEIQGKAAVFFSITEQEYDSIYENGGYESGIDEWLSDFNYYASNVVDSLQNTDITSDFVANRYFKIHLDNGETITYDRLNQESEIGLILTDGRSQPKFDYGVGTDIDYYQIIEEYFGGEKRNTGK